MTSLCRRLSLNSIGIIVNWVMTADGCVDAAYTTQLDFTSLLANLFRLVETVAN